VSKQAQIPLSITGAMSGGKRRVDASLVHRCKTEQEAARLCIQQSPVHLTYADMAEILACSAGHLNQLVNCDQNDRLRNMSRVFQINLQRLCQNSAIDQWADAYENEELDCQRKKSDEIADLKARLALLERGA